MLAIVTAVNNANSVHDGTPQGILDGFHAALFVSVAAAGVGILAMLQRRRAEEAVPQLEEVLEEAA